MIDDRPSPGESEEAERTPQGSGEGASASAEGFFDVAPTQYRCPNGDFSWVRQRVGEPVPLCPVHHIPLDPV